MPRFTIVGAGQSGLPLAIELVRAGNAVTLVTNRSGEDVAAGRIMSTQCLWHDALAIERTFGLNLWDEVAPPIAGFRVAVADQVGQSVLGFDSPFERPGQSVDQRLKMPAWMQLFRRAGGKLVIQEAGIDDLEGYAADSDLVIVTSGKGRGAMRDLFPVDATRVGLEGPQRSGASVFVHGLRTPNGADPAFEDWIFVPGVGEFWFIPAYTLSGRCHIICLEAVIGGPLDRWTGLTTASEHLSAIKQAIASFLPAEAWRCRDVELTDGKAFMSGALSPTMREAVAHLPSGRPVLGLGDAVILHDPISAQGGNNALKAMRVYLAEILARGEGPFDAEWMRHTAGRAWRSVADSVRMTDFFLKPPVNFIALLREMSATPDSAISFARAINNPRDHFPWPVDAPSAVELPHVASFG